MTPPPIFFISPRSFAAPPQKRAPHLSSLISPWRTVMKLEDLLMNTQEEHRRRCELQDEVADLQDVLEREQKLNGILQKSLHGSVMPRSSLSSLLPVQVQVLLAELAMVEEEIAHLERKVKELKLCLYRERKQTTEILKLRRPRGRFLRKINRSKGISDTHCQASEMDRRNIRRRFRPQLRSAVEATSSCSDDSEELSLKNRTTEEDSPEKVGPNELSEELVKCLVGIFHKLSQTPGKSSVDQSTFLPKISLSCISSKGSTSKSNLSCKTSMYPSDESFDAHGLLPGIYGTAGERGTYKYLVSVTKTSLDISRINQCFVSLGNLRKLIHGLRTVDLAFLKYKQKLAFWINVYNACIMNAFLQHDLPSSSEKLLELLNKAAFKVGGIVLNALAIEHFILRQRPSQSKMHSYCLNYPEPNVTFALCRGTWSSPALRIYTAENVTDELERAKAEYLEAFVQVTSRRRIFLPKLLFWHMTDFADDLDSLVEWVYSQLPTSLPLKKSIMECLKSNRIQNIGKLVEIQPYNPDFRYLLPSMDLPRFSLSS